MSAELDPDGDGSSSAYEEALDALSSLITRRTRADGSNKGDGFDVMFDYLKILELDEAISELKVIHVAGTKGKGSTCTFVESILRNCGFRTGLFTSPHLIDVRERFRLDSLEISEEKFLTYFWWCWNKLKEKIDDDLPMPNYFRFLALLSFKVFTSEKVDVAILEVGLGGKFDATNVVKRPVVCGISSLGYDHMEILGHTLGEIAGEKAGIFKHEVPAFTVEQSDEAMSVLIDKASQLSVPLQVSQPLDSSLLNGLNLGLDGNHQYLNAGLAIALCRTWLLKTGHIEDMQFDQAISLPEEFVRGLANVRLQGRAQILMDPHINMHGGSDGGLIFFLDGAHSPESMDMCAKWFSCALKEDLLKHVHSDHHLLDDQKRRHSQFNFSDGLHSELSFGEKSTRILIFNCMAVRDPMLLLPPLVTTCSNDGIYFQKAIFVPNLSVFNKVGSHSLPENNPDVDLSWQRTIQQAWENIMHKGKGERIDHSVTHAKIAENSIIFQSLPLALKWLRDTATKNQSIRFQVLVTGSLHLVGDLLKILNK